MKTPVESERDVELAAEGWVRRFATEASKAGEYAQMYEELGFEVKVEPVDLRVAGDQCRACLEENCRRHVVVYTRGGPNSSGQGHPGGAA